MQNLYYVVGPSGAGKDSILNAARSQLTADQSVVFAHRYITRPADAGGENHIALSVDEFQMRKARGLLCLDWESHGLCYGLGSEVRAWLDAGLNVVMNGSRGYLAEASKKFETELIPVLVEVDGSILRERLRKRGRETPQEIEKRVERANAFKIEHSRLQVIANNGPLDTAVSEFLILLRRQSDLVTK